MHFKRRRPKNRRAGCLLCKPWKANHAKEREKAKYRLPTEKGRVMERAGLAGVKLGY